MVPATVSQLVTLTKDTPLVSIIAIQVSVRSGRILSQTAGNPFVSGDVSAPILQVKIFVGVLFVAFNLALSRLSRRRRRAASGIVTSNRCWRAGRRRPQRSDG